MQTRMPSQDSGQARTSTDRPYQFPIVTPIISPIIFDCSMPAVNLRRRIFVCNLLLVKINEFCDMSLHFKVFIPIPSTSTHILRVHDNKITVVLVSCEPSCYIHLPALSFLPLITSPLNLVCRVCKPPGLLPVVVLPVFPFALASCRLHPSPPWYSAAPCPCPVSP